MASSFFRSLIASTSTRLWVNNPTSVEIDLALERGAVGCTTNPAFVNGLLRRAPDEVVPIIAGVVADEQDDQRAAELVQERIVQSILPRFAPQMTDPTGPCGLVSLQGAPQHDMDASAILAQARRARALGPNCVPKIAATAPGLDALDVLVGEAAATIVTEVFSLAQIIETCERYRRATAASGLRPALIVAPITGIFGDHLRVVAERDRLEIDGRLLEQAGVAFGRAAARLVREREYPVTLLFGGARTMLDLTGLVGSQHHATVNWTTFAEVLEADPPVQVTIDDELPATDLEQLTSSFDAMRVALAEDGLAVEEFEGFGPVQHFRDNFVAGWQGLLDAVSAARHAPTAARL